MSQQFRSFDDFFLFYLRQHSRRANRRLHACGTALGLLIVVASLLLRHPWWALLWLPVGYGLAWAGHLLVEGNRPATWGHPWWSFLSDFRMTALMATGRLHPWIEAAEAAEGEPARSACQD
jgi:hypothetical protein